MVLSRMRLARAVVAGGALLAAAAVAAASAETDRFAQWERALLSGHCDALVSIKRTGDLPKTGVAVGGELGQSLWALFDLQQPFLTKLAGSGSDFSTLAQPFGVDVARMANTPTHSIIWRLTRIARTGASCRRFDAWLAQQRVNLDLPQASAFGPFCFEATARPARMDEIFNHPMTDGAGLIAYRMVADVLSVRRGDRERTIVRWSAGVASDPVAPGAGPHLEWESATLTEIHVRNEHGPNPEQRLVAQCPAGGLRELLERR